MLLYEEKSHVRRRRAHPLMRRILLRSQNPAGSIWQIRCFLGSSLNCLQEKNCVAHSSMSKDPLQLKTPADFIRLDYDRRKKVNTRFSLRAYAKHLDLSIGRLSELLNGKSPLTLARAKKIAPLLRLSKEELDFFWGVVQNDHLNLNEENLSDSEKLISETEFSHISDWEYFACMALFETKSFSSKHEWISKKLKMPRSRLETVLNHLLREGYITKENDTYKSNFNKVFAKSNVPSKILQNANVERMQKSILEFATTEFNQRDVTSLTFPVDVQKIPEAKILIKQFKENMIKLLQTEKTTEVYFLNIQLFPISNTSLTTDEKNA